MKNATELDPQWEMILRNMLGAARPIRNADFGYRNRYCTTVGSANHQTLLSMKDAGLVVAGETINQMKSQMFHATLAGCQSLGLSNKATRRALED